MTLKELRISKGLNQAQCAEYLGMSTRNYQNYENDAAKANTARYHAIYQKLESYGQPVVTAAVLSQTTEFHTNVVTGTGLQALANSVAKYGKRDCFSTLQKFVAGSYDGKICILYGLRRTGKTTLLFQMLSELPIEKTAYIKVQTTDDMSRLTKDLKVLFELGYRYVFIDEITLLNDFIDTAAVLSDVFSMMGMKIVVSGTDSLGFAMANRDELYDRSVTIHTSFIPFREYARLLNICSVDSYIEYGGTLKMENMSFDDPDAAFDEVAFRDDESTRKYIDTAISRNIQHTLKNDHYGEYFNQLRELYEKGELTNVINRIVQHMNHRFVLRVVEDEFKSHDFGSAKELLLHDLPAERATVLYDVNEKQILERLKAIIEVKEKSETTVPITQEHIDKVKKYLLMLDLIVNCPERYESGKQAEHIVFSQPGMRYAIAKALVYSLMQDAYFASIPEADKAYITGKILDDVKGRMLEDIVLLEVCKAAPSTMEAFKFKFDAGGEFDMVIYDKASQNCRIYEIKHSTEANEKQTLHLRDAEKCRIVENRFGPISGKFVLYRGKDTLAEGVQYLNVENFLCGLK
ncbi:AAA family ATPase [Flavonifractor plautii]|uniref:AAA family ATPase n=1 Tax=Flavonifractor plautii TaxID=292800 RepID=UPI0018AA1951|nr:AAA family ATPase [Flavonifractor plautii]MDB7954917.1 AAA family ATPase [Flavonifractor plautii]